MAIQLERLPIEYDQALAGTGNTVPAAGIAPWMTCSRGDDAFDAPWVSPQHAAGAGTLAEVRRAAEDEVSPTSSRLRHRRGQHHPRHVGLSTDSSSYCARPDDQAHATISTEAGRDRASVAIIVLVVPPLFSISVVSRPTAAAGSARSSDGRASTSAARRARACAGTTDATRIIPAATLRKMSDIAPSTLVTRRTHRPVSVDPRPPRHAEAEDRRHDQDEDRAAPGELRVGRDQAHPQADEDPPREPAGNPGEDELRTAESVDECTHDRLTCDYGTRVTSVS